MARHGISSAASRLTVLASISALLSLGNPVLRSAVAASDASPSFRISWTRPSDDSVHSPPAAMRTSARVTDSPDSTADNPIVLENRNPGSNAWVIGQGTNKIASDREGQIKGYASLTSVNKGGAISFKVSVSPSQALSIRIFRLGWYQGLGGRLMTTIGPLDGVRQPDCVTTTSSGLIECTWTTTYRLSVPTTWTSGVFLAVLTNQAGFQNYINFTVRDDDRHAPILFQNAVTTWQAYNNYPDDGRTGKSLYLKNSFGPITVTDTPRAVKVSFDRPYSGPGSLFLQTLIYEIGMVRWLEREGYDVSYATNVDTHTRGANLLNHKAFLSVGHDEYWSGAMRNAVTRARDAGIDLGFFGANAIYWRIRFERSPTSGAANRIMTCYKRASLDPVKTSTATVRWREPPVSNPEQGLLGIQYSMNGVHTDYVIRNSKYWVYEGTGFADSDSVPGIVGYEVDRYQSQFGRPPERLEWARLSRSPFINKRGTLDYAESYIYRAVSGAWVFAAGTIWWGWALDDYLNPTTPHPGLQRMTSNILDRFVQ